MAWNNMRKIIKSENIETGVMSLVGKSCDLHTESTTQTSEPQSKCRADESYQLLRCQLCSHSQVSPGLLPHMVTADHHYTAVPVATEERGRQRPKPHKPSRAEQTGFTELQSSQAPIPRTTLVARSLSQGLWAGKYGFMCAHITFGSREAFKSNYRECYLHELLF